MLGDHVGDESFCGFEIVGHGFGFIFAASVFEYRRADNFIGGVFSPDGVDEAFLHVHPNFVGCQVDIVVFHFAAAVHESRVLPEHDERVFCREIDRVVDVDFFAYYFWPCRVGNGRHCFNFGIGSFVVQRVGRQDDGLRGSGILLHTCGVGRDGVLLGSIDDSERMLARTKRRAGSMGHCPIFRHGIANRIDLPTRLHTCPCANSVDRRRC